MFFFFFFFFEGGAGEEMLIWEGNKLGQKRHIHLPANPLRGLRT